MNIPDELPTEGETVDPKNAPQRPLGIRGSRRATNTQETLDSAVKLACKLLKGDLATIALADEQGNLTIRSWVGISERGATNWRKRWDSGPLRYLSETRRSYFCSDLTADPYYEPDFTPGLALSALAAVPLKIGRTLIGFLCVGYFGVHRFTPQERQLASLFASHASIAIETASLFEEEQQERRRSDALLNVAAAPRAGLSLSEVLAKLCRSVIGLSVAESCAVFVLSDDETSLEKVLSLGGPEPHLWEGADTAAFATDLTPPTEVIKVLKRSAKPIVDEDAVSSGILPPEWVEHFNLKSLVIYPLLYHRRLVGTMTVYSGHSVSFPEEELATIAAIARQAAVLIENARLYENERRQRQRSEALVEVLSATASSSGMKQVLIKLCQAVVDLSVADRCSIFLSNERKQSLEPVMSIGIEDPTLWQRFQGADIKREESTSEMIHLYDTATALEKPIIAEDAPSSPFVPKWLVETFNLKSIVEYPLRINDKTIGMMVVDSFQRPVHFPKEEVETLAAIAKQAAIIIDNTRLHEQLKEQAITDHVTGLFNHRHIHERLDEEFARAARSNSPFAVMMMDLDSFKLFNDTYGHVKGDEALRFVGRRLQKTLRTNDIVGRYGGDEFVAILPETTREEAEEAGQRLMATMAKRPFSLGKGEESVKIDVSVGIACYPHDSKVKHDILALADAALYEAKRLGGKRAVPASANAAEGLPARSLGFGLLQGLLSAIAHKDPYTKRHCEDIVHYVDNIAERLNLSSDATESLRKAALLHDVGKIAIPDRTLMKPGPLDNEEWGVMQQHVRFGEMIVRGIAEISDAIEPVATHHERFDGNGYPRGLKGEDIPQLGRILAVIDAYSAMTIDRPYRKALPHAKAIEELRKGAGSQFDPVMVEAFLATMEDSEKGRKKIA